MKWDYDYSPDREMLWIFPVWVVNIKYIEFRNGTNYLYLDIFRRDGEQEVQRKVRSLLNMSRNELIRSLDVIVLRRGDLTQEMLEALLAENFKEFSRLAASVPALPPVKMSQREVSSEGRKIIIKFDGKQVEL
ncbi:hypothetical protein HYT01_03740 [Candidatus Giovannonibacteria bacterium]|nr:hypothetical protein [Candidatus Giovannonibacteria bacterium]